MQLYNAVNLIGCFEFLLLFYLYILIVDSCIYRDLVNSVPFHSGTNQIHLEFHRFLKNII